MERILKVDIKSVAGTITLDIPKRSERLVLMKEMRADKMEKGNVNFGQVEVMEKIVKSRFVKCDLMVNAEEYDGLSTPVDGGVRISTWAQLEDCPIADTIINYVSNVILSGKLRKLTEEQSEATPKS